MIEKRYKVTTGTYIPEGNWNEQPNLMTFKQAASYAAKVANQPDGENETIRVWDANQEAVIKHIGDKIDVTAEFEMPGNNEWAYIAAAIKSAVDTRQRTA